MAGPVDLDDEARLGPLEVEVRPPARQPPHRLSRRLREATSTHRREEVELAQGVGAVGDVVRQHVDEPSPGTAPGPGCGLDELRPRAEPLLHGHDEE